MNRLLSCCAIVALASGSAFGATFNVPGDFADIQTAIDNAAVGDVIQVEPGSWAGFVVDVEGLTIESVSGSPADTTIDGADDQAILVVANDLTLRGFTVENGKAGFGNNNQFEGGCLDLNDTTGTVVENMQFVDCQAEFLGGAVYLGEGASASIAGSGFSACSADFGGAIGLDPGSMLELTDCNFTDNRATRSGGAIDAFQATVNMEACCFTQNLANRSRDGVGGAINNAFSLIAAANCVFDSNFASRGGAAWYTEDGQNVVCFSTFYNNVPTSGGGFEQDASPSVGSPPSSASAIYNSIFVDTTLLNNNPGGELILAAYSFSNTGGGPGVIDGGGNLVQADLPNPSEPAADQLFNDAENGDFTLVRCDPCAEAPGPDDPPCYTAIVIDAGSCELCADFFFDKADNCRGIDVVDNPATGECDEGIENTGVACLLRNCTYDAPDMGAYEYVQIPVEPIPTSCEGDTNLDGIRNILDLLPTLNNFGQACP